MPKRPRRIETSAPLRSSLANAAFAVEERVVWGGVDVLRSVVEVVKWPFERAAWALERGVIWPLEERTGKWSEPVRVAGVAALALLAVAAGVFGLLWASGSGGGAAPRQVDAVVPVTPPVVRQAPQEKLAAAAPVLHGAVPDFSPKADAAKASGADAAKGSEAAGSSTATAAADPSSASTSSATAAKVVPAGPAATKVAQRFAGAFVLYETGKDTDEVREAFAATATPQLTHQLLQRPPRQPANVKVPKAKVLNVVAGPRQGNTYTLSVSLLRVGITSELRLTMERDEKTGEWQVTDVLG